jgi:hypothetical protein
MARDREPPVEPTGKVLTFPSADRQPESTEEALARVAAAVRGEPRRGQRWVEWIDGAWVLLASVIAACRVWSAAEHREVFGVQASIAFALVVSVPVILARRILAALRHAGAARRRKGPGGGGAVPDGPGTYEPERSRRRGATRWGRKS